MVWHAEVVWNQCTCCEGWHDILIHSVTLICHHCQLKRDFNTQYHFNLPSLPVEVRF